MDTTQTFWRREKSVAPSVSRSTDCSGCSQVTVPAVVSCLVVGCIICDLQPVLQNKYKYYAYILLCCYMLVYTKMEFPYQQLGISTAVSILWSLSIRVRAYIFLEKSAECYIQVEDSSRFLRCY
jgi:hypothetical protein